MTTRALVVIVFLQSGITTLAYGQAGVTCGSEYGLGFIAQIGPPEVKLEVGAGVLFFVFFANVAYGEDITEVYFPATVGAKLSLDTVQAEDENRLGIKLGMSYNTLFKTGYGGGIDYQIHKAPKLVIGGGVMIYPAAKDELLARLNKHEGTSYMDKDFSAPWAKVQPFISFSVLFDK